MGSGAAHDDADAKAGPPGSTCGGSTPRACSGADGPSGGSRRSSTPASLERRRSDESLTCSTLALACPLLSAIALRAAFWRERDPNHEVVGLSAGLGVCGRDEWVLLELGEEGREGKGTGAGGGVWLGGVWAMIGVGCAIKGPMSFTI